MPVLYGRMIEVEIAGLVIRDLRIRFDIERQVDPTQDAGQLTIYNLSDGHADRIFRRGGPVTVRAGYPETIAVVFEGSVQRIRRKREGLAFLVQVQLGDQVRGARTLAGTFRASYEGHRSAREIAVAIIEEGLGLKPGPLDAIPESATFNNFYWPGGPATVALTVLLRPLECRWFEQDGLVRINRERMLQSDGPAITKTPATGLVRVRNPSSEGATCELFLDARVVLGTRLTLDDNRSGRPTSYKVVGVRHRGDNWVGEFLTECELRPWAA